MQNKDNIDAPSIGVWLDSSSSEFKAIYYNVVSNINESSFVKKIEICKIENNENQSRFERNYTNANKINCWVNFDSIGSNQSIESICKSGFDFSQTEKKGMDFFNGSLDINSNQTSFKDLILINVDCAVGRSYIVSKNNSDKVIPEGFDSLYIMDKSIKLGEDNKFQLKDYQHIGKDFEEESCNYKHKFFLNDAYKVIPKYIVKCSIEKDPFIFYRIESRNIKEPVFINPNTLETFSESDINSRQNFFTKRKMEKTLTSIDQAFLQAMNDFQVLDQDPFLDKKKDYLEKNLTILDDKVREINLNYADVLEGLTEAYNSAVKNLQYLTKKKLDLCLSSEIEFKRNIQQLNSLNSLIRKKAEFVSHCLSDPRFTEDMHASIKFDFLKSWKYLNNIRNSMIRSRPNDIYDISKIHGDMKFKADLSIFVDPFFNTESQQNLTELNFTTLSTTDASSIKEFPSKYDTESIMDKRSRNLISKRPFNDYEQPKGFINNNFIQEIMEKDDFHKSFIEALSTHGTPLPNSIAKPALGKEILSLPLHELFSSGIDLGESTFPPKTDQANLVGIIERPSGFNHFDSNNALTNQNAKSLKDSFFVKFSQEVGIPQVPNNQHTPAKGSKIMRNLDTIKESEEQKSIDEKSSAQSPLTESIQQSQMSPLPYQSSNLLSKSSAQNSSHTISKLARESSYQQSVSPISSIATANSPHKDVKRIQDPDSEKNIENLSGNRSINDESLVNIKMSIEQLSVALKLFRQFSLKDSAQRKKRQIKSRLSAEINESIYSFSESKILTTDLQREILFYSLPFFSKPPVCKLVYSTDLHERSLASLFSKTSKVRGQNLLLLKSGEFIFGAYLTHPIIPTCTWTGSPSCFLFSLTMDTRLPFHAKILNNSEHIEPAAFYVQSDAIYLGYGDLSIDENIEKGSSELENCFGCGFPSKSPEAMCLLAGSPLFYIDELEIWSINA